MRLDVVNFTKKIWSKPFNNRTLTIELVSIAPSIVSTHIKLGSSTKILTVQQNIQGWSEETIVKISHSSQYQILKVGTSFFDRVLSNLLKFQYLEPDLWPCITDILDAWLWSKRDTITRKTVTQSNSPEKAENWSLLRKLMMWYSILWSRLGADFLKKAGKELGKMLRAKRRRKSKLNLCIVYKQCVIKWTDLNEFSFVGYTQIPSLSCFPHVLRIKEGDLTTTV